VAGEKGTMEERSLERKTNRSVGLGQGEKAAFIYVGSKRTRYSGAARDRKGLKKCGVFGKRGDISFEFGLRKRRCQPATSSKTIESVKGKKGRNLGITNFRIYILESSDRPRSCAKESHCWGRITCSDEG